MENTTKILNRNIHMQMIFVSCEAFICVGGLSYILIYIFFALFKVIAFVM